MTELDAWSAEQKAAAHRLDNVVRRVMDMQRERRSKPWLPEEDTILRDAISLYGAQNWGAISGLFFNRSAHQCQQRWEKMHNPSIQKGPWTKEVCPARKSTRKSAEEA